jgi:hypothetical protein
MPTDATHPAEFCISGLQQPLFFKRQICGDTIRRLEFHTCQVRRHDIDELYLLGRLTDLKHCPPFWRVEAS